MAYTLIQTVEIGSGGAASIEFNDIAQEAGADLVLMTSLRGEGGAYPNITLNGSSANYSGRRLTGGGDYVSTGSNSVATSFDDLYVPNTDTANTFGSNKWYFSNYAGATAKSVSVEQVNENNATSAVMVIRANLWNDTAAITSIELNSANASNEFAEGSTASLYLVTTADATGANSNPTYTQKATGGTVTLSNGYYYHVFTGSGTFTPTESITADVLRIGGGGGGGSWKGGGGGAGGFITSQHALTATNYTVVVGAGGAGTGSGSNSTFTGLTNAIGGGNGGAGNNASGSGVSGGSGGGGGYSSGGAGSGSQGNDGAVGQSASSGGGGGAEFPGYTGSQSPSGGGYGGGGLAWFNGTVYAGGGGGGTNFNSAGGAGGDGGGGNGAKSGASGTAGQSNTGGGGGSLEFTGGQPGGSGIVIVRYAG